MRDTGPQLSGNLPMRACQRDDVVRSTYDAEALEAGRVLANDAAMLQWSLLLQRERNEWRSAIPAFSVASNDRAVCLHLQSQRCQSMTRADVRCHASVHATMLELFTGFAEFANAPPVLVQNRQADADRLEAGALRDVEQHHFEDLPTSF